MDEISQHDHDRKQEQATQRDHILRRYGYDLTDMPEWEKRDIEKHLNALKR